MSNQTHFIEDNTATITIALICPEIPQNTGNIARLCKATGCSLVLVRPLGFRLTDKGLQRAGMDYWKELEPIVLDDVEEFLEWSKDKRVFYLSAHGKKNYAQARFRPGDVLAFGSESAGLPELILKSNINSENLISLPMMKDARCINIATSVSASLYEALRQIYNWSSPE
jgi:tRNA (cytidine/uridine-2'-O-)-methyltransferase